MKKIKKLPILAKYLLIFIFLFSVSACDVQLDKEDEKPARYGDKGRALAIELAEEFPDRFAGSEQEKLAANWLLEQLDKIGYKAEVQEFTLEDSAGDQLSSQNIIVTIEGVGFSQKSDESDLNESINPNKQSLIIAAHYDTPLRTNQVETSIPTSGDGIHNNAAGVASLLTLAEEMQKNRPGYHVNLVFFGGSEADYAGARAYLAAMTEEEIALTAAMYNIDRIYAGNKVYAHAGTNSLINENEKEYDKRFKLYEMTDVYYNNLLLTNNNFSLHTNQNIFSIQKDDLSQEVLYREWTLHTGDHTPFDQAGIPIVFIESFEYDVESFSDLGKESTDPNFLIADGIIERSNLDSSKILNAYFQASELVETENIFGDAENDSENYNSRQEAEDNSSAEDLRENKNIDRLERRINNSAFLLLESSQQAGSEYELNE